MLLCCFIQKLVVHCTQKGKAYTLLFLLNHLKPNKMNNSIASLENQFSNLAEVKEQLFETTLLQLHSGIEGFESPNNFGIYKKTGGQPLGVVGKSFAPQNLELIFEALTASMIDANLDLSTLRFNEYKGGQIVEFSANLADYTYNRSPIVGDITSRKINLRVGLNGRTKTTLNTYATRLWCTNGCTEKVDQMLVGFKNTKGNAFRAPALCGQLIETARKSLEFHETLNRFIDRKVTVKESEIFLLNLLGAKKMDELSTRKSNMLDAINACVAIESKAVGRNLFSLYQGVTRWTTYELAAQDVEAIKLSSVATYNDKAFELANNLFAAN